MLVTDQLREAIREYLKAQRLTLEQLAVQIGTTGPTIGRWLNGRSLQIRPQPARRLCELLHITRLDPLTTGPEISAEPRPPGQRRQDIIRNTPALREFIMRRALLRGYDLKTLARLAGYDKPDTLQRLIEGQLDFFPAMLSGLLSALAVDFAEAPLSPTDRLLLHPSYADGRQTRDVPVLSMAHAAQCRAVNGALEPPAFWEAERLPVPTDGRRYVAFRVEGNSMAPRIRDGDIVLCDLDAEIQDGQTVVARFGDQVVCKRLHRVRGQIVLSSDNQAEGEDFRLAPEDVAWMVRAVRLNTEL